MEVKNIEHLIEKRCIARQHKDYVGADEIRTQLYINGIIIQDHANNTTTWKMKKDLTEIPNSSDNKSNNSLAKEKRRRRRKAKLLKKSRFNVFIQWLVTTFDKNQLQNGIIDVAGGKGKLSIELALTHQMLSTVVDPNPTKFSIFTSRRIVTAALDNITLPQSTITKPSRCMTWELLHEDVRSVLHANDALRIKQYLQHYGPKFHGCLFDAYYHSMEWKSSEIVIGMHPDEATEAIVDWAILHQKSFAVVPCCVFPTLFPNRLLENQPVRTLEEFILYLKRKHPLIQETRLNFHGCNRVLYLKQE